MADREKLIKLLEDAPTDPMGNRNVGAIADHLIAHGVTVRKTGRWIDKPTGRYGQMQSWCSACNQRSGIGGIESNRHKPFCPNCGAPMNGGADQ